MELAGRTVLVTGAARGIGRELTRQLVGQGAHIIAIGRDAKQLGQLADAHPGQVTTYNVDLADPEALDAAIAALRSSHPELSVLINNAGVQASADFTAGEAHAALGALRQEIAINLAAPMALCAGLLPILTRHTQAAVVNVTSGLAIAPKKSAPGYCATKAALRSFSRALRYQCEDEAPQVSVLDIVMPLVATDMTRGRGGQKMTPDEAAACLIGGLRGDRSEVFVGRSLMLHRLMRFAPALGHRLLRDA